VGQSQVQDDAVYARGLQHHLRLHAIASRVHAVAGVHELRAQTVAQQFVVFYQ